MCIYAHTSAAVYERCCERHFYSVPAYWTGENIDGRIVSQSSHNYVRIWNSHIDYTNRVLCQEVKRSVYSNYAVLWRMVMQQVVEKAYLSFAPFERPSFWFVAYRHQLKRLLCNLFIAIFTFLAYSAICNDITKQKLLRQLNLLLWVSHLAQSAIFSTSTHTSYLWLMVIANSNEMRHKQCLKDI